MLRIEDAIHIDVKVYKGRTDKTYTYIFKCQGLGCNGVTRVQKHHISKSNGKCKRCSQKGEPFEAKYNELVKAAKRNKRQIDLSFEEFLEFTKINNCHYCTGELIWEPFTKTLNSSKVVSRAYQLDRKDSSKGYNKDNCVACCWECNRMKSNMNYWRFIDTCRKIANNC